eukprot:CAMPEP_0181138602 /NCGR_PEP_ID=MMETSP1071-20121207/34335_1 /TAXON_ID=35127 /ORGANISM="Thalassiosira sp., Strain NH16" /LENGTH=156 /DNA_ID=CAMNT_0023225451 /DNA_START=318 /DNA_END=785 /DNA_ORIENTATION=-
MSSINSNASRKRHHDDGVADSGSEMTTAEMKSLLHQSLSRLKSVESNVSQMQSDIDELKKTNSYLQNEIASMRKKNCSTMMSGDMTPQYDVERRYDAPVPSLPDLDGTQMQTTNSHLQNGIATSNNVEWRSDAPVLPLIADAAHELCTRPPFTGVW